MAPTAFVNPRAATISAKCRWRNELVSDVRLPGGGVLSDGYISPQCVQRYGRQGASILDGRLFPRLRHLRRPVLPVLGAVVSNISTEYRGYKISFGDNSEEWSCSELSFYGFPKLSTLKARVDKMLLDVRKKSAVSCFEITHRDTSKTPGTIVDYVKMRHDNDYARGYVDGKLPKIAKHVVAVVAQRSNSDRAARGEKDLDGLMPDTPEALAAFEVYAEKVRLYREAGKAADMAYAAVPRVTVEMIAELKRIKEGGES